ncbi:MAG: plasma-membrane proton-efflux P-type ATPase [Sulfurovaceae bacterium]|nr:plasma-membrane proton-efflux P-type ATPase [Sulfurovaceae bacterium]
MIKKINEQKPTVPLATSTYEGLTSLDAKERLQQIGQNMLAQEHSHRIRSLLHKFWGMVPWMLELAIILDLILGRWIEAIVIIALLVFNAAMGFLQENRAQQALALLRQRLTITARVHRDGLWQMIPSAELVPGDLIRLRVGDVVPADIQLTDGHIQVDQSQLTGESRSVDREAGSSSYAGSQVTRGEATGMVTATGTKTYFGKTVELVRVAEAPSHLELLILQITRYLAVLVIVLALAVFISTLIHGESLLNMLPLGLMLLVAAVPVALPTMFTMSAAIGARALAENGILVTHLSAIQDAAAMNIICLDKTGTITENRLSVERLMALNLATEDEVLRLAALASDEATQDPLDLAILQAAHERGLTANIPPRFAFIPFDPDTKRSEVSIRQDDQIVRIIKGAPSVLAELAQIPWSQIAPQVEQFAASGSRVLAVATGTGTKLHLAGLIALNDPPRPDSAALITALRKHGVRVILVTGDGEETASAVATKVGMTGKAAPAGTLHENIDPDTITHYEIFAGVLPQDKFFLVQALQKAGHVVGMTGDGVNDAPALRQADIGIAVATATDVAKAAASLVLTHPGLDEVVKAIEESRRIYQRMQTWIMTMMTRRIFIPPFLALGVIVFGRFVLNPTLLVLLVFVTDAATMSLSTDRVTPSLIPERWAVRSMIMRSLGFVALLILLSATVWWVAVVVLRLSIAQSQTLIFVWLVFGSTQANLYSMRTRGYFWEKPHPGRWIILATILDLGIVTLMATQGWLMAPIPLSLIGGLLLLAILFLASADLLKLGLMRFLAFNV